MIRARTTRPGGAVPGRRSPGHHRSNAEGEERRARSRTPTRQPGGALRFVAARLEIDELAPTPIGCELVLRGVAVEAKGRKAVAEIALDAEGKRCARARAGADAGNDDAASAGLTAFRIGRRGVDQADILRSSLAHTASSAVTRASICASVCSGVGVMRRRSEPRGTVG